MQFPELLGLTHKQARDIVSDHAPIYITVGDDDPEFVALDGVSVAESADSKSAGGECVNINKAMPNRLDELPHIGPARAEAVIDARPYQGVDGLTRVSGVGPTSRGHRGQRHSVQLVIWSRATWSR
ncbi:helix-hairpin-helix domain-containing protein [Chromohalobacter canadensis]|nr:helix-hairpin-helix domain-containing protein [Chromohalobacter canadensis]MCT8472041.1 helix-hairpin-helix domain-containing protein [Chromohalobacter canadensis]